MSMSRVKSFFLSFELSVWMSFMMLMASMNEEMFVLIRLSLELAVLDPTFDFR